MTLHRWILLLSIGITFGGGSFSWAEEEEAGTQAETAPTSTEAPRVETSSAGPLTWDAGLKQANDLYQKGNCAEAVPLFSSVLGASEAPAGARDEALYRKSYCQLLLGNASEAFEGFSAYLAKYPKHEESRLKAGEAAYYVGKQKEALEFLKGVQAKPYSAEARLLEARIAIDKGESEEAFKKLRLATLEGSPMPITQYWRGVAEYGAGDLAKAAKTFDACIRSSAPEQWTIAASKGWLERIEEDSRFWHYRLGVGAFFDGNTAQSSTLSFTGAGGPSNNGSGGSGGARGGQLNTVYPVDRGLILEPSADFTLWRRKEDSLTLSASGYGTIYQNTPTSTFASLSARLDYSRFGGGSTRWGISATYQDTRIRYLYYQDFFVLTPYSSGKVFGSFYWNLAVPVTMYMVTQSGYIVGPTAGIGTSLWKFYVSGGFSGTYAQGPKAVIKDSSTPGVLPSVTSGSLFSQYLAFGPYVSLSSPFLFGTDLSATVTQTTTRYEAEDFPKGMNIPEPARQDTGLNIAVSLTKVLIPSRMWVTASGTYLDNKSTGFSGFFDGMAGAAKPTYTYSRPYLSVSFTTAY